MPKIDISKFAPLLALIVLIIISAILSDHFLIPRNLTNVLRQVSYTGIIALGMTFVIIACGIDLSVGSMVALVGVITVSLINTVGGDGWSAVFIGLAAAVILGAVFGAINGLLITRGKAAAFVATLATMALVFILSLQLRRREMETMEKKGLPGKTMLKGYLDGLRARGVKLVRDWDK